ncbi:MAG: response regulator transcription factor [Acidimicrobiia bacterium]
MTVLVPLLATQETQAREDPIRVVVVDDHELVRQGLRALVERQADFCFVGEASSVAEGVRRVAFDEPDVVVLDFSLGDGTGAEACRQMLETSPNTKVLILTGYADGHALDDVREAGASGFLLKSGDNRHLTDAIRQVARGETVFDGPQGRPEVTRPTWLERLTDREQEILSLISEGLTNREIADRLYLAEKTIKNYVSTLLAKLGVDHRSGAAALYADYCAKSQVRRPPSAWPNSR